MEFESIIQIAILIVLAHISYYLKNISIIQNDHNLTNVYEPSGNAATRNPVYMSYEKAIIELERKKIYKQWTDSNYSDDKLKDILINLFIKMHSMQHE